MDEEILSLASVPRYHLRLGLRVTTLDPDTPGPIAACFPAFPISPLPAQALTLPLQCHHKHSRGAGGRGTPILGTT